MIVFAPDIANSGSSVPVLKSRRATAALSTKSGRAMKQASGQSRQLSAHHRQLVGQRVCEYLYRTHPHLTAKCVARRAGMNVSTVEKMLERESAPDLLNFLALFAAYGFEFVKAAYGDIPEALQPDFQAVKQARLEAQAAHIARELAELRKS